LNGYIDRSAAADSLAQPPDTADEVNAIVKNLGVAVFDIHLGETPARPRSKRTLNFLIVRRSNFGSGQAATDGRATTRANQRKALQQAIDAYQPRLLE